MLLRLNEWASGIGAPAASRVRASAAFCEKCNYENLTPLGCDTGLLAAYCNAGTTPVSALPVDQQADNRTRAVESRIVVRQPRGRASGFLLVTEHLFPCINDLCDFSHDLGRGSC